MKNKEAWVLILKLILLLAITGLPYLWLVGKKIIAEDHFYWKTTSKGDHLIIGGSRAQKGISPAILSKELELEGNFLNIAFTLVNSPYGEYYSNFIQKKLNINNKAQLFILEANAGLIMDFAGEEQARERDFRIYDLFFVNIHPNIEYFIRNSNANYYTLKQLLMKSERLHEHKTHRDGWVEFIDQRDTFIPLERMRIFSHEFVKNQNREKSFRSLVENLADKGKVFLVRLPIHEEVTKLEDNENEFFSDMMNETANISNVYYLDYSRDGSNYSFYDYYHHLTGTSARQFSKQLAKDIMEITSKDNNLHN